MTHELEGLDLIPEHAREEMRSYINDGIQPGKFLSALLSNDLFASAYWSNLDRIGDYITFLTRHAPPNCFGSRAKVEAWIEDAAERRAHALHAGPQLDERADHSRDFKGSDGGSFAQYGDAQMIMKNTDNALEEKIADLETRLNGVEREIGSSNNCFEKHIRAIEARLDATEKSLRKQRAVNDALLIYLETQHPFKYGHVNANALGVALREALKND